MALPLLAHGNHFFNLQYVRKNIHTTLADL